MFNPENDKLEVNDSGDNIGIALIATESEDVAQTIAEGLKREDVEHTVERVEGKIFIIVAGGTMAVCLSMSNMLPGLPKELGPYQAFFASGITAPVSVVAGGLAATGYAIVNDISRILNDRSKK